MKKVIVGKSKGLADAEQCDIHAVGKRSKLLICKNNEQHLVYYYKNTKQKVCMLCGEQ